MWPFRRKTKKQTPITAQKQAVMKAEKPLAIKGDIGYHNLADWWLSAFTDAERKYIESVYQPVGTPGESKPLTQGEISSTTGTAASLLSALGGWFKHKPEDREIATRILEKAEELARVEKDVLSLHFTYQQQIELQYRWRDAFPEALDKAIEACEKQIALAPKTALAFMSQEPKPAQRLFSVELSYQRELDSDNEQPSKELRQEFENNGIALSGGRQRNVQKRDANFLVI